MSDQNYTIVFLSQNGAKSKRFTISAWVARALLIAIPLAVVLAVTLLLDYRFVVNQVFENRELQAENRRLRQNVQSYKSRMESLETSMDRIQSFSTRLRIMTNLEDKDNLSSVIEKPLPSASTNLSWVDPELANDPKAVAERNQTDDLFSNLNLRSIKLEQSLTDLFELLSDQKAFLLALPTKRPALGFFTSGFGVRFSPMGDGEKMHEGLDIANVVGTPIKATAQGTIVYAGPKAGYGQIVIVDHGYGLETWYGHTSRILVKPGQYIKRGQEIAKMGNSGHSTGPHVHYEIRVHGWPVDPFNYILEN